MNKVVIGGRIMAGGVHPMPLSKAVRAKDRIFVSGPAAIEATGAGLAGGIEARTRRVPEAIRAVLEEAGTRIEIEALAPGPRPRSGGDR